jgi:uncharacterized membrane protein YeaQ/YmgE (transglycosylase-associated protein family)
MKRIIVFLNLFAGLIGSVLLLPIFLFGMGDSLVELLSFIADIIGAIIDGWMSSVPPYVPGGEETSDTHLDKE